jgi:hypothetical protein
MRILYIGSQPEDQSSLELAREINELQQHFAELTTQPLSFIPLTSVVEDLPRELVRYSPEILHIASHADKETLKFAQSKTASAEVTARALRAFLNYDRPPRLVYLNACNSQQIAEELAESIPAVIGSTAPISNHAARSGAVTFYERILAGAPVKRAFLASREIVEALARAGDSEAAPSMALFNRPDTDVSRSVLHPIPRLMAELIDEASGGKVRLGVSGCPPGTQAVAFFTDDEGDPAHACSVVREAPRAGYLWDKTKREIAKLLESRICAAGMMMEDRSFSLSARLAEAFNNRYRRGSGDDMPPEVAIALRRTTK